MKKTSPFADKIFEEGTLEISEGVPERSASLDPPSVLSFDATEREGVECVQRTLEQLGGEVNSGTQPVLTQTMKVRICGWQWTERWGRRI